MKLINSYLPFLENGAASMNQLTLIKECIRPNIPGIWKEKSECQGGKEKTTIKDVQKILCRIEKWDQKNESKRKNKRGNGKHSPSKRKDKEEKGEKGEKAKPKNPCKLPNHGNHEWKDCFNNPKSNNFKGTAKNWKDYDSNGKRRNLQKKATPSVEKEKQYPGQMKKAAQMKKTMLLESMTLPKTKFLELKYSSAFRRQTTQKNMSPAWDYLIPVLPVH